MISNRIVEKNNVVGGGVTTNLWGWGKNSTPSINTGTSPNPVTSPLMSDHAPTSWKMISHGDGFACGISNSDKLYCWGLNTFGQLGINNTTTKNQPTAVGSGSWNQVSCGTDHVLALNSSNKLYTWGRNDRGQLGLGNTTDRSSPVQLNSTGWFKISAGHKFSAAITDYNNGGFRGYLYTWGRNNYGQLGDGTTTDRSNLTQVTFGSYPSYQFSNVSAGYQHTLATMYNYSWFLSWGRNDYGQLGTGNQSNYQTPTQVASSTPIKLEAVGHNSAFIDVSNNLYVFGCNSYGQLGNNAPTSFLSIPTKYFAYYTTDVQMVATTDPKRVATFVITEINRLYSWGRGSTYLLGNGSNADTSSPAQVGGSNNWLKLSVTSGGLAGETMFALK